MVYRLWAKVTDLYVIVNCLAAVNDSGIIVEISADFIEGSLSGIDVPGITESHGARRGWMNEDPHDIKQVLYRRRLHISSAGFRSNVAFSCTWSLCCAMITPTEAPAWAARVKRLAQFIHLHSLFVA